MTQSYSQPIASEPIRSAAKVLAMADSILVLEHREGTSDTVSQAMGSLTMRLVRTI